MSTLPAKYRPWIRGLADYGPLILFLLAYFLKARFTHTDAGWAFSLLGPGKRELTDATWWLVGGSVLGLALVAITERRIAPIPAVAGGFALVFGGLTLIFHDSNILKLKPTFSNLAFSVALFVGLLFRRNPLRLMLGEAVHMEDGAWRTLTFRYALFFLFCAGLNEILRRPNISDDLWLLFRMPGLPLLMLVFSLTQAPFLMKHMREPPAADKEDRAEA